MNTANRRLARIAYWIACLSPFSVFWILGMGPELAYRKGLLHEILLFGPTFSAVAAIILGALCLADSFYRHARHSHSNYAKAAVALGLVSLVGISMVLPVCLPPNPRGHYGTTCISNVKQIDLGVLMYAQDYDDRLPRAANWVDATLPYIKNELVYRCPAEDDQNHRSYGFNRNLSGIELAGIGEPARTLDLIDSQPGHNPTVGVQDYPFTDRHGNYLIAGFADGHAKRLNLNEVLPQAWKPAPPKPEPPKKEGKTAGAGKNRKRSKTKQDLRLYRHTRLR